MYAFIRIPKSFAVSSEWFVASVHFWSRGSGRGGSGGGDDDDSSGNCESSGKSYLARVDSLSREGIVVGTHLVAAGVLWRQGVGVVDRKFGYGKSCEAPPLTYSQFLKLEVCAKMTKHRLGQARR